jgi:hypothetical protein
MFEEIKRLRKIKSKKIRQRGYDKLVAEMDRWSQVYYVHDGMKELVNKVKNGDDLEAIKKATETLSQAAQKIGEKLYAAAQAAASQSEASAKDGKTPEGSTETPKDAETEAPEAKADESSAEKK